jgi:hypothetical protein
MKDKLNVGSVNEPNRWPKLNILGIVVRENMRGTITIGYFWRFIQVF